MLSDRDVVATIAVKDLARAKAFYGGKLGLAEEGQEGEEAVIYRSGATMLLVYRSAFAGTNQATAATWSVGDQFEAVVAALKQAGVSFEHYDIPGISRDGDIHHFGDLNGAWCKDPDGNILHINSR